MKYAFTLTAVIALSACAPFQPYTENSSDRYYIIQPGDNFDSIAFALETTPEQLQRANPWANSRQLQPGVRLSIPQTVFDNGVATAETDNHGHPKDTLDDIQLRSADYIWPLHRFEVSSNFGFRGGRQHSGIDLSAPRGTPIHAAAAGRIKFSSYSGGYGNMVVIDHGRGIETSYAHNNRNLVVPGQRVEQGEVIARVGRSGNATGYHVHFEFRRHGQALNPAHRIQAAL